MYIDVHRYVYTNVCMYIYMYVGVCTYMNDVNYFHIYIYFLSIFFLSFSYGVFQRATL